MRKNIRKFAGIVLCIGMFTGCAQTPDSSLVKPKGSKAVDAYTEADDVSGSKGEASESKNDDGSESKTKVVVRYPPPFIEEEGQFQLPLFRHSRHGASLNKNPPISAVTAAIDG